ncbi:hypothetical protein LguiA_023796 [Lonicera macranthoides]
MPCGAIAVANSPVFSSSPRASPIFRKPSLPLNLNLHGSMPSPSPSSSRSSSFQQSPLSPLTFHIHKNQLSTDYNRDCKSPISTSSSPPMLLKRKRPSRIDIPIASLVFKTPAVLDCLNEVEFEGESYSVYCKRGKRSAMEDRYSAVVGLQGDSKQAFFGVFDGHGGVKAAEFAAKNMEINIRNEVTKRSEEGIRDAIREGYLATDSQFLEEDVASGTCCVTAMIRNGNLIVSNAGDCRAVMSQGGLAEALTVDHRPSRSDEKERIEHLGGYVDCCRGVWRIQGSLAVSRGIGDRQLKQWVIAEPETRILSIRPECEFLILASDGLWDKVSNQEAVDLVRPLCIGVHDPRPISACKKLAELSVARGSSDDISVLVIQLGQFVQ